LNAEVSATRADGNIFRPLGREQVTGEKPQVFRINRDSPALPFAGESAENMIVRSLRVL
jgi:hypothetical protein